MRILVADDEAVTRQTLVNFVEHLGHECIVASDGAEAWAAIEGSDTPPLLILDWMMPPPSGPEICRRLRARAKRPYQYIVMLTARDAVEDVVLAMEAGADDYLRKPFDLRELRVRVRAGERMLALQDELNAKATTDELTGLLNRRGIVARLEHEVSLVSRGNRSLSVLILDVDNFKIVNDTHGHAIGDEVLKEVASRMRRQLRAYDDLGRYGGEEFAVVLPACGPPGAFQVAERIRQSICSVPVSTSAGLVYVTISAGIASCGEHQLMEAGKLISAADAALYSAKANGRNRVDVADVA